MIESKEFWRSFKKNVPESCRTRFYVYIQQYTCTLDIELSVQAFSRMAGIEHYFLRLLALRLLWDVPRVIAVINDPGEILGTSWREVLKFWDSVNKLTECQMIEFLTLVNHTKYFEIAETKYNSRLCNGSVWAFHINGALCACAHKPKYLSEYNKNTLYRTLVTITSYIMLDEVDNSLNEILAKLKMILKHD